MRKNLDTIFSGDVHNAKGENVSVKANTTTQEPGSGDTEEPGDTEKPGDAGETGGSSSDQNENTVIVDKNSGWNQVIEELNSASAGGSVTVKMSATTVLSNDVLDAMKGKDVNLVIVLENGVRWKINGKTVSSDELTDIDLNVELNVNVIPQNVVDSVADGKTYIELSLSHDGPFPFDATLVLNVGAENAGQYANLYYYNPTKGKMEIQTSARIDASGNTELLFKHASDYVIVVDSVDAYKGGDTTNYLAPVVAICMGCLLAVVALTRKKVTKEEGTK